MTITDWIPALSTTSLLVIVLWLLRNVISTRLTNSVRHEYDEKLESIRAKLRKSEESFKAELRTKESQIEALRSGALTSIVNRQVALYERQIVAVEQLWNAIIELAPAKAVSTMMASIKFEVAAKSAAEDHKTRDFFNLVGGNFDLKNFKTPDASKTRPFVSVLAWAYYSAYEAIVMHAAIKLHMLKSGIDMVEILNAEHVKKLIKVVLPHQAEYVEKYGHDAFHYLLEELESNLLAELDKMLKGDQSDKENVEKAAKIMEEAERLQATNLSLNKTE
jgi:hypothetical protein